MSVTRELLQLVDQAAAARELPAVAEVFVPASREDLGKDAEFCVLRLTDDSIGTAFVLLDDTLQRMQSQPLRQLEGTPAREAAQGFAASDPVRRALGLAAINAITQCVYRRAGYTPDLATNSLGSLELAAGDRLGMIGFFPPLVRRVREMGIALTVVELRADLVREEPGFSVTLDPARLAACNKIVSTSTILLNDTLDGILARARHAEVFAVIGPSAGCFPDPLFARGVTTLGGHWVTQPDTFMHRARALESWGDAADKCSLRRADYPGTAALLARIAGGA